MGSILSPLAAPARTKLTELGGLVVPDYRTRRWWYHDQIAEALEGLLRYVRFKGERGGYARVLISMPPQHGKSLHGTELFPAFALGQDPDLKIIVASNGATLAKKGIANARQWMQHEGYLSTFPTRFGRVEEFDASNSKKTRSIEVESSSQFFRTIKKGIGNQEAAEGLGYYLAQGLGGSITGWGYDLGIMDDLIKNAEQALSRRHHEKLWEFYTATFATRQRGQYSGQLYIGTRWTAPDFADELLEYWEGQSTASRPLSIKVLRLPALADGETQLDKRDPRSGEDFVAKYGAGLDHPKHRDGGYYESERAGLMTQTPWVWFGMYQQWPKMAGRKFFQPHEWMKFTETFNLKQLHFVDFSIDAQMSKEGPSFTVIQVWGVLQVGHDRPNEQGEHFFLLDESRGHYGWQQLDEEFMRLRRKWEIALPHQTNAGAIWCENKALGPTLITKYQGRYPLVAVPKAKAKGYCYSVASAETAKHRVWIPSGTWGKDPTDPTLPLITDVWVGSDKVKGSWVHEMMSNPSKPDDRRDATSQEIICRTSHLGMHLLAAA